LAFSLLAASVLLLSTFMPLTGASMGTPNVVGATGAHWDRVQRWMREQHFMGAWTAVQPFFRQFG
jgi:hypothetical protein